VKLDGIAYEDESKSTVRMKMRVEMPQYMKVCSGDRCV